MADRREVLFLICKYLRECTDTADAADALEKELVRAPLRPLVLRRAFAPVRGAAFSCACLHACAARVVFSTV
jgi:hypothetical protein